MPRKAQEILDAFARPTDSPPSLWSSEADLKLVFDYVSQNVWRLDRALRVRYANVGAAAEMGLTPETAVGVSAERLLGQLDPQWREHIEQAFASQAPFYGVEAQSKPRGRAPQWTSTDFVPEDEREGSLLIVSTDITLLKEREGELEVALAEVDHSRRLFERHYRRTPVLLCSFQRDGRLVEASDVWRDKLGYARDEVLGRKLDEFMHESSRGRFAREVLPQLWRTGACEAEPLRFSTKAGRRLDAELSGFLGAEDDGAPICLSVLIDVTARNAAERALERANRELASVNEGLKRFAQVASHDLQEPLRKIKQIGDLMISEFGDTLDPDASFYIGVMRDSAERMRHLIRDILSYSRSVNATFSRTRVSLNDVARDILSEFDIAVREAEAKVRVAPMPDVLGDRIALELLMRNFIGNSLKYRRPGVVPEIVIDGEWRAQGAFELHFHDNGRGIDPRYHQTVFEPFTRLQPRQEVDGSGIGLAICKAVCDRQQWRLSLRSAPGEGALFTILIPGADVAGKRESRTG